MNYQQVSALKKNERIEVCENGKWKKATFQGFINGADPAAWIAYDERQTVPGSIIATKVYTGLQFTEEYWNAQYKNSIFRSISEEELNAELLEHMEASG
ncbi:hypothetical protein QOZ98_000528 [Planomicrobium stackebrandtii]|uniref:Uncharacterized protein n=1 Tax=Planomicrobium stackebrandtii TaxID=253160 RepID=A0ABU0GRM3_9BACL|nr:hypothetical protein [Planomicrobium stackebrandtii]MDQ0427703.1 hypothetical protein [Planomicrobium stackebrandtii]